LKRTKEETREPLAVLGQHDTRDRGQRAGQHRGAADPVRGKIRGARDIDAGAATILLEDFLAQRAR